MAARWRDGVHPYLQQPTACPAICASFACLPAEQGNVSNLKNQLGTVKEAVQKEQGVVEKLRREAMAAAASAQRQVRRACVLCWRGIGSEQGAWRAICLPQPPQLAP